MPLVTRDNSTIDPHHTIRCYAGMADIYDSGSVRYQVYAVTVGWLFCDRVSSSDVMFGNKFM